MSEYGKLLLKGSLTAAQLAKKAKVPPSTLHAHLNSWAKNQVVRINKDNLILPHPKYLDKRLGNTYAVLITAARALIKYCPDELPEEEIEKLVHHFKVFIKLYEGDPVGDSVGENKPPKIDKMWFNDAEDDGDYCWYAAVGEDDILVFKRDMSVHPRSTWYKLLSDNPHLLQSLREMCKRNIY